MTLGVGKRKRLQRRVKPKVVTRDTIISTDPLRGTSLGTGQVVLHENNGLRGERCGSVTLRQRRLTNSPSHRIRRGGRYHRITGKYTPLNM